MRKNVSCNSYSNVQQLKNDIDELKCSLSISINETKLLRLQVQEMCNAIKDASNVNINKSEVSDTNVNEVKNEN